MSSHHASSSGMDENDDLRPSFLALIVETHPGSWKHRSQYGTDNMIEANELIAQITFFCHSYALMHRSNRILVIANHPNDSVAIFPRRNHNSTIDDDFIPVCHTLQSAVSAGLRQYMSEELVEGNGDDSSSSSSSNKRKAAAMETDSSLSQALSMALCVIHRQLQQHPKLQVISPHTINCASLFSSVTCAQFLLPHHSSTSPFNICIAVMQ